MIRQKIFQSYAETQANKADPFESWKRFEENWPFLKEFPKTTKVLEIGFGPGALITYLEHLGFCPEGIDLSETHVEEVSKLLKKGKVYCADVRDFLPGRKYGLIVSKAVLEHVEKGFLYDFLETCARGLEDSGALVIEVPNMDWICAPHERYMDLTHEVGFTETSLRTALSLFFNDIKVYFSRPAELSLSQRLLRALAIKMYKTFLKSLGESAACVRFESRSLIALCRELKKP